MRLDAVLAAVLAVVLVGCSSSSKTAAKATPTQTPTPPAKPTTAAASPTHPAAPQQSAVPAEKNPPGDIPDNLAFVRYSNAAGRYQFTHPEGWAEAVHGANVLFTDKLNGVTVAAAKSQDVPTLRRGQPAFALRSVTAATVPGGSGVRIIYRRNSAPDAVTGRQYRDEVERYELVKSGREVVLEMYGPVGADNVDAYRTMVQSLRIR